MSKIPEQASSLAGDSPHLDVKKRKIQADGGSGHYYVDKSAAGSEAVLPGGAREVGGLGDAKSADATTPGTVPLTDDVVITSRPVYTEVSVVGEAPDAVKTDLAAVQPAVKPAKEYPFVLDTFQREAIASLERNQSVLVSAHTSAGKTVVAEYAIAMCLRDKQRVIYTSPIKALSNQKYRDMYEEFSDVGLMTGDVTIAPNASCLIMTTEVLRSMLYRGSEIIREVAWVIFDEIHYMRDRERGVVWEESIIMVPHNVRFVFLSATIPNAKEFAAWVAKIHKQPCSVVYTDYRPTPLQHFIFPAGGDGVFLVVDEKGKFRDDNFQKAMALLGQSGDDADPSAVAAVGGGAGGKKRKGGPGKGGKDGPGGPTDLFRVVKMVMDRNYDPVIVFSFSKRECEQYALQLAQLDFTTDDEKKIIRKVFTNAIDSLSDDDKSLPQIEAVFPLLRRGIGMHHGGLLPIIKEVIEILFQESLLKVLFCTETFSMGINMPAKTVVFTASRKFDGTDFRWISPGEYIQMSGRAGRRGLDDRGIVIQMIDEKMEPAAAKEILKGNADPLNSSFHLGYNMLLNLLRVEGADPEHIMSLSFYQYQCEQTCPALEAAMAERQAAKDAIEIVDEVQVAQYHALNLQLAKCKSDMKDIINTPKYIVPFLQPGRLVRVKDETDDWGWGVVLNYQKKTVPEATAAPDEEAAGARFVVDVLLWCALEDSAAAAGGEKRPVPGTTDKGEMRAVPVLLPSIDGISSVRIYVPKDVRDASARSGVKSSLTEVARRFPDGVPLLDPIEDMSVKSDVLPGLISKIITLQDRLEKSPFNTAKDKGERYSQYQRKVELDEEVKVFKREIKATKNLAMKETCKRMIRVLRRLGHIDSDNVVQLKGRVACEINTSDELLVTELMFNGAFNDLTPSRCAALLSCLVFTEKGDEAVTLSEEMKGPLRQMQDAARRIATVCQDAGLTIDVEEFVQKFKPDMMELVSAWCNGAKFSELLNMTKQYEGTIIRVIRRLEELLRQLGDAAKAIGDTSLEEKFKEACVKIRRDIIFAASLYI